VLPAAVTGEVTNDGTLSGRRAVLAARCSLMLVLMIFTCFATSRFVASDPAPLVQRQFASAPRAGGRDFGRVAFGIAHHHVALPIPVAGGWRKLSAATN
jgi:hypothetical protein